MSSPEKKGGSARRPYLSIQMPDGSKLDLTLPEQEDDVRAELMAFNPDWLSFSPLESEVLTLLCESGPLTARAIGTKLDRSPDAQLKDILANLGARRIIGSGQEGYAVNLPGDRVPAFLEWLKKQAG